MKRISISEVMTPFPHSVGQEQPVKAAHQLMNRYGIRHLPVKHAGKLVGVISDRDVDLALRIEMESNSNLLVNDVQTTDVLSVPPEEPVANVAKILAERRIGCAIVTNREGSVIGVFTSVDACRLLGEILTVEDSRDDKKLPVRAPL